MTAQFRFAYYVFLSLLTASQARARFCFLPLLRGMEGRGPRRDHPSGGDNRRLLRHTVHHVPRDWSRPVLGQWHCLPPPSVTRCSVTSKHARDSSEMANDAHRRGGLHGMDVRMTTPQV
ncbi:hypothetical protein B0T18DRAFT_404207 [Schizothecium vesticola]|uniref:Secreted protein n=1 Tax=Schizothecium vesticola TaxID=314040 RepID=A0AA40F6L9_9PEZI|nr:hypothetical protein B0T18DRAFT_404207 [Schizothecium vesticola]